MGLEPEMWKLWPLREQIVLKGLTICLYIMELEGYHFQDLLMKYKYYLPG